jgi:outer membrane protein insertion porin family
MAPGTRHASFILIAALLVATPADADVRDFVGRRVVDVRVELGTVPLVEPSVLQLVETRVGEPLSMEHVRETIDHLVGSGRFEDVRVFVQPAPTPDEGVVLRWMLVAVQRIGQVQIVDRPAIDEGILRAAITERFGVSPPVSRVPDIEQVLAEYYRDRGYRRPTVRSELVAGRAAELMTLNLTIDPGPRTVIREAVVRGDAVRPPATLLAELRLDRGRPYDRPAIENRLSAFEEELRDVGYYEANVDVSPSFSEDDGTVDVMVDVERGPRVRVVFAGDRLPENQRDTLVPIRQERSVDLDLLEDASRNIQAFLREQGYRAAEAPYVREEKAGEMVLTFTVARGPLHRLASIEVIGASAVPLADIAPLLVLKPGEPLVDSRIAATASAVTELYRVRGFAQAVVKPEIALLPTQDDNGQPYRPVAVRLLVTEGAQTTVGSVVIAGAVAIAESHARAILGLTSGRPFYRPQLGADRDAIERLYQNEGFRGVRVEAETLPVGDGAQVDIRWNIREGPKTVVDHVLVSGNVRTSAELIRREMTLRAGAPLGDDALLESQRRLAALGLFRRVRIVELPHGVSEARDILVEVEEAPATSLSYGGGLEAGRRLRRIGSERAEDRIEVAPRGFFAISRRNLWGKNRSVSLFTRVSLRSRDPGVVSTDPTDVGGYGFNEYRVVGTFREPRPLDSPGDLQLTGFIEQAIRSSFNFSRSGVRTEYARRIGTSTTVSGRYALDRTRLFDEQIQPDDQLLIDRLFPRVRLSTLTASVLQDSRNDVLDPERGSVLGIDATIGPRWLGSEVGFLKTFVQGFAYRRLPGAARLTVAAGIRMGFAAGFERPVPRLDANGQPVLGTDGQPIIDVITDVPASERFFAGGDTTVRGFVLDRLGTSETLNDQGFPTGGNGLAVVNVEVRTPYWKGLGGVGFVDAGNVFRRVTDISFGELRPAAGAGLRYRSPLGPVRVDFGFNLNRNVLPSGVKERGMVFHISLGQAF